MLSAKYSRTYHYPFSLGATNDDRIKRDYWSDIQNIKKLVHTEKLDGENNCLNKWGVFARSHATPTTSPWTSDLRMFWQMVKNDLGDLEIFLENLYAIHSIEYKALESYYHVFAIREGEQWLSWDEVKFYASMIDLPTVPELSIESMPTDKKVFEQNVLAFTKDSGALQPFDVADNTYCSIEGVVTRNANAFSIHEFEHNVFKWVREGHVKTNEHWTKNWKRAVLKKKGGSHVGIDKK